MNHFQTIGFIGGGALGGALNKRLAAAGHKVLVWDLDPHLATAPSQDALVQASDLVLICAPSQTNRAIASQIAQAIPTGKGPAVLSLAKGVEDGFITMDRVLAVELGERFVTGVISGPMLAGEIAAGGTSGAVVATTDPATSQTVAELLGQAGIITQTSTNPTGVATCGALKNVYALTLGLADGLELSYNTKSVITTLAVAEFRRVLTALGSDVNLAFSLAGLGDLLTTGWSGSSFNWRVGQARSRGEEAPKGEGARSLSFLADILDLPQFTLMHWTWSVFYGNAKPDTLQDILAEYTRRPHEL